MQLIPSANTAGTCDAVLQQTPAISLKPTVISDFVEDMPRINLSQIGKIATTKGIRKANEDEALFLGIIKSENLLQSSDPILEQIMSEAVLKMSDTISAYIKDVPIKAFQDSDEQWKRWQYFDYMGTTFATTLFYQIANEEHNNCYKIATATLGDSNFFVLCIDAEKKEVTVKRLGLEHNASDANEANRIRDAGGGVVKEGKYKGYLAAVPALPSEPQSCGLGVSRGIGTKPGRYPGFSHEPSIAIYKAICPVNCYLQIIGLTDGISKKFNEHQIAKLLTDWYKSHNALPENIAEYLVQQALLAGSRDNCTAIVMPEGLGVIADGFGSELCSSANIFYTNVIARYVAEQFPSFLKDAFLLHNVMLNYAQQPKSLKEGNYHFLTYLEEPLPLKKPLLQEEEIATQVDESSDKSNDEEVTSPKNNWQPTFFPDYDESKVKCEQESLLRKRKKKPEKAEKKDDLEDGYVASVSSEEEPEAKRPKKM